jgi:hypothetical protein
MTIEFNLDRSVYDPLKLPCGGTAYWDAYSGISHRCEVCLAVVGSIDQPQHCKDEAQKYEMWEKLGGKGWDYYKGMSK